MKGNLYLLISYYIVLLLLVGCNKEAIEGEKAVWQQVSSITNDSKIILNASTDGKQLFTYGPYNLNITDSQLHSKTIIHGANSLNIPPTNGNFFGYFFEDCNLLFVNSYQAMQSHLNAAILSLGEISATAKAFNTTNLSKRYVWALSDQGQVLLSVKEQDDRYSVYLVSFNIVNGSGAVGRPYFIKKIGIAPLHNSPTTFYFLQDRFFFFANENGIGTLYTLDKQGDVIATNSVFDGELFFYKDVLYLVHGNELRLSKDGGLSFNEHLSLNQDLSSYYFRIIKDKIFVFKPRSGIGLFEFTPGGFQIKEVVMTGLEGNLITQLTLFNEKLFVSTLTGLYYKDWQDVLK